MVVGIVLGIILNMRYGFGMVSGAAAVFLAMQASDELQ